MPDPVTSLDDQVRAADPDRWLSSRFVGDAQARADLIALAGGITEAGNPNDITLYRGAAQFSLGSNNREQLAMTDLQSGDQIIIGERDGKDIVTVRATEATQSKQALTIFTGISANTAGAKGLSL